MTSKTMTATIRIMIIALLLFFCTTGAGGVGAGTFDGGGVGLLFRFNG